MAAGRGGEQRLAVGAAIVPKLNHDTRGKGASPDHRDGHRQHQQAHQHASDAQQRVLPDQQAVKEQVGQEQEVDATDDDRMAKRAVAHARDELTLPAARSQEQHRKDAAHERVDHDPEEAEDPGE